MIHEHIHLIDAPAGSKYLLRFVGDPVPSRCVYHLDGAKRVRRTVVDAVDKLQDLGIKIYHEAYAVCMDVHGDGCLSIVHFPEPLVFAIQRFVQAGGPDPGTSTSVNFLVEVGTGDPISFNILASKPSDLGASVYERAASIKGELYKNATGDGTTTAEVLELQKSGLLVIPYQSEGEAWFEPAEVVELLKGELDRMELYEKFITYASECCDDEEVAMIAGIICRTKEKSNGL